MKKLQFKLNKSHVFDPSIEMGIMIKNGAIRAYGSHHGLAALGQMMDDIAVASFAQNRAALLAFPIVGAVVTRPAGGTSLPY